MQTRKLLGCIAACVLLSACASGSGVQESKRVQAMQAKDKHLSCRELLLEINEAEFTKGMAEKNRGPQLKNILMPIGYISTYMNAGEAVDAANARISYLDKIYEISNCEDMTAANAQADRQYIARSEVSRPPVQQQQPASSIYWQMMTPPVPEQARNYPQDYDAQNAEIPYYFDALALR